MPLTALAGYQATNARWAAEARSAVVAVGAQSVAATATGPADQAAGAVLLHGLGGAAHDWGRLMAALPGTLPALAPDLPGFGESEPLPLQRRGFDGYAGFVAELVEQVGGGRPVHLIGNSLGGTMATRVAARRPDLVRTLTLVAPALPNLRPRGTAAWFASLATPGLGSLVLRQSAALPLESRLRIGLSMVYGDPQAVAPEVVELHRRELTRRDRDPRAAQAMLRGARDLVAAHVARPSRSLWADAARVAAPTLLLYGGRDRLVDARSRYRAVRTFPCVRLVYLPRSGHVPQLEHPEVVAEAFADLLTWAERSPRVDHGAVGPPTRPARGESAASQRR